MSEQPFAEQHPGFEGFVAAHSCALLKAAWLLTGDWQMAEDLLQTALVKSYLAWHRVDAGREEAYVRRVLFTTYVTWWRRAWRAERPTGAVPDLADLRDGHAQADLRRVLLLALSDLPRHQRDGGAPVLLRPLRDSDRRGAGVLGRHREEPGGQRTGTAAPIQPRRRRP